MTQGYRTNLIRIQASDAHAVTAIKAEALQSLQAILSRLSIEYVQGFPGEVYAMALYDELCENRQLIPMMLPAEVLKFLIRIWENDSLEINGLEWDYLKYLTMFGFIYTGPEERSAAGANRIYYVRDMKEKFYFFLKSHTSRTAMDRYEEWGKIIQGLMYTYGLIEMHTLYYNFLHVTGEPVLAYEDFDRFIKCRTSLWGIGSFLRTTDGRYEYFQHNNVEQTEWVLEEVLKHEDLPYYIPRKEAAITFAEGGGFDRSWDGFTDLTTLLGDEIGMDYYRTSVVVRSLISAIQNGFRGHSLKLRVQSSIAYMSPEQKEKMVQALDRLCDSVPIFGLKGNSRGFFRQLEVQEEQKKRKRRFTMIQGGLS